MAALQGDVSQLTYGAVTQQQVNAIMGRFKELGMSQILPEYAMATLNEYTYHACTQAGIALTVALGTVVTGFCLSNAPGSGRVLMPLQSIVTPTTAPAGIATMGWGYSYHASTLVVHTTPLVVRSGLMGALAAADAKHGLADSAATVPATQVAIRPILGGPVAAASISDTNGIDNWNGCAVLLPGGSLSTFVLTTAISAMISMTWLSLPL